MVWAVAILCLCGFVMLWRIPRCSPSGRQENLPTVSVIIPARNEERNIGALLDSLRDQSVAPHEVIVVDDASDDRTAAVASERGATVVTAPPLPEGWRGKTWACRAGAKASNGDLLLFLDADTVLKPGAILRMTGELLRVNAKTLSLAPYHDVREPYEELSGIFNLMTVAGMGAFSLFGSPSRPAGLFGPVVLIDRGTYQEIGGHESVRGEILEHMKLGRIMRSKGIPIRCLGGRGTIHTRMYPDGLRSMAEGWSKAFASGAAGSSRAALFLSIAWMTGGMLAWIMLMLSPLLGLTILPWLMLYGLYAAQTFHLLRQVGWFSVYAAVLYPVLLLFFFAIFGLSIRFSRCGGRVTWKGRVVESRIKADPS